MNQLATIQESQFFELIEQRSAKEGRPTKYSLELAATIIQRIQEGESLTAICRPDPDMPNLSTVYLWMQKHSEFSNAFSRARAYHAHSLAARTHDLAEQAATLAGQRESRPDAIRVAMAGMQWLAGKYNPECYGDKQTLHHTGNQGVTFNLIGLDQPQSVEVIAETVDDSKQDDTARVLTTGASTPGV